MAYQYVVTAQKPTAVTKCIAGTFTSPNDRNLIIAKNNKIEIYTLSPEGLKPIKEISIYGKITVMLLFRPEQSKNQDFLFILTDRYHGCILYCKQDEDNNLEVITKASGDLSDPVGRPPDSGIIGIIDPYSKLIGLRLYEGVIKFLPYDVSGSELKPFNVKVEQLNMIDAQFMYGCNEPTIAIIFQNTQGRHVSSLKIDTRLKEVQNGDWTEENIEFEAQTLIPIPKPMYGVIIVGCSAVTYKLEDKIILSVKLLDTENPITCFAPIDVDYSRILLGNQNGDLYMLILKSVYSDDGVKVVESLNIKYIGQASIPEAMCYLDNGVFYVGSRLGDSQLIKFVDEKQKGDGGSGQMIQILESFTNIGPIVDMCVVDLDRQGQNQLVTCSGAFKDGSLRVVRNGIGIHEHASFDLKSVKGMWPLKIGWSNSHSIKNDSLIVSCINHSRILKFDEDGIEEKDLNGYDTDSVTLYTANVCFDQIVQVTDKQIRLLNMGGCNDDSNLVSWQPTDNRHITVAAGNFYQLLVACGNKIFYLEITRGGLVEVVTKLLQYEVACLSIKPLSCQSNCEDEQMDTDDDLVAKLCAVGLWKDNSARIYAIPSLEQLHSSQLSTDIIPRSIELVNFEGVSYCLSSLGDGNLVYYQLNPITGFLSEKKTIQLTTCPTILKVFALPGGPTTVFACSDRPSVIYSSNKKLVISNVNLKRVTHMCVLDSDGYPNSLAIANEDSVILGVIDAIQKLHIGKIQINESPRRIAYQEQTRTFAVSSTRTDRVSSDGRLEPVRQSASTMARKKSKDPNALLKCSSSRSEADIHNIIIFDEVSWDVLHSYQLAASEECLSIMSCSLGDEWNASYFIAGTAFVCHDETEPRSGRIIVFRFLPSDNSLQIVAEKEVKGAVYSICSLEGSILASVNNTVCVYEWLSEQRQLRALCSRQGNVMALYLKSCNDQVLVGDIMRSMSVLHFNRFKEELQEVARDYNPNWMTAVEMLDEETFIGSENFHNIIVCQKKLVRSSEVETTKLVEVGNFHVGDFINTFRHGTLVMQNAVETELKTEESRILYGTVAGCIGVVVGLQKSSFEFLLELQTKLAKIMYSVGNIKHENWRSFCTVRKTEPSQGFIDGDLIESFLDLPREDKKKIASNIYIKDGSSEKLATVDELIKKIEELSRLH